MHYKIFVYSNTRQQSARQTAPVPLGPYRSVEKLYLWEWRKISSHNIRKKYMKTKNILRN